MSKTKKPRGSRPIRQPNKYCPSSNINVLRVGQSHKASDRSLSRENFSQQNPVRENHASDRAKESYNSKYKSILNATEQKILKTVEESVVPITPLEISVKTGINHTSVRVYVRKLETSKYIHKAYYGHYESMPNVITPERFGGGELQFVRGRLKPCVHNLQFVVSGVRAKSLEREVVFGAEEAFRKVVFDVASSGTVVVYVTGEFDAVSFPLLIEFLKLKLGVTEEHIVPKRAEFNNDIQGLQLEGANCLTVRGIQGDLIRLYNKDKHTLRREVKPVHVPRTVAEIDTLIQGGGLPSYYILQSVGLLVSEVKRLFEAQKYGNRSQAQAIPLLRATVERLDRLLQKLLKEES